jgi:hypothetical protein
MWHSKFQLISKIDSDSSKSPYIGLQIEWEICNPIPNQCMVYSAINKLGIGLQIRYLNKEKTKFPCTRTI